MNPTNSVEYIENYKDHTPIRFFYLLRLYLSLNDELLIIYGTSLESFFLEQMEGLKSSNNFCRSGLEESSFNF